MPYIFAVDFDGTLCELDYPSIGAPKKDIIEFVRHRKAMGDYLILWTCREGELLEKAVAWCKAYDIQFDAVNANLPHMNALYGNDSRKIGADFYLDDKAITLDLTKRMWNTDAR